MVLMLLIVLYLVLWWWLLAVRLDAGEGALLKGGARLRGLTTLNSCAMFCSVGLSQRCSLTQLIMFELPCGTKYKAKRNKRGYHAYGVVLELEFPWQAEPYWTLASSHVTAEAAKRALKKALKESSHGVSGHVVEAS